jgi:hypothetical protein
MLVVVESVKVCCQLSCCLSSPPVPFSLDCLQIFLDVVLDLMTRPHRRPFFLYVNAFCFPREGRLHQYFLLCDVDVDGLLSRVVCAFSQHFLRVKFGYRGLLLVVAAAEVCSFWDGCHRPVAADDVRKMLLLVEVPLVWRGDGCVWVAELVLICLVVVLVVAVAVAADGVVVPDPWEFIS